MQNKSFAFETLGNIMKIIHHLWENDTSVKRLLANPSWLAIPRSFLSKGRGKLLLSHNQDLGFSLMLSPMEALSAPPSAQLVPNIPHSGQRNQAWALIIYPNAPAPLAASGSSGVCSDQEIRCCACPGHLSPAANPPQQQSPTCNHSLLHLKTCFYLAPRTNSAPSYLFPCRSQSSAIEL